MGKKFVLIKDEREKKLVEKLNGLLECKENESSVVSVDIVKLHLEYKNNSCMVLREVRNSV